MPLPEHVQHWPIRHQLDPRCHAPSCPVTDPALLHFYLTGLCCADHVPRGNGFVARPREEHVYVPAPERPVGRHGLLPNPLRRRQPRKRSTA